MISIHSILLRYAAAASICVLAALSSGQAGAQAPGSRYGWLPAPVPVDDLWIQSEMALGCVYIFYDSAATGTAQANDVYAGFVSELSSALARRDHDKVRDLSLPGVMADAATRNSTFDLYSTVWTDRLENARIVATASFGRRVALLWRPEIREEAPDSRMAIYIAEIDDAGSLRWRGNTVEQLDTLVYFTLRQAIVNGDQPTPTRPDRAFTHMLTDPNDGAALALTFDGAVLDAAITDVNPPARSIEVVRNALGALEIRDKKEFLNHLSPVSQRSIAEDIEGWTDTEVDQFTRGLILFFGKFVFEIDAGPVRILLSEPSPGAVGGGLPRHLWVSEPSDTNAAQRIINFALLTPLSRVLDSAELFREPFLEPVRRQALGQTRREGNSRP